MNVSDLFVTKRNQVIGGQLGRAGIVDGLATIANGKNIILYVWYDNEYGYSHQVVRVIEELAGTHPPKFPQR